MKKKRFDYRVTGYFETDPCQIHNIYQQSVSISTFLFDWLERVNLPGEKCVQSKLCVFPKNGKRKKWDNNIYTKIVILIKI